MSARAAPAPSVARRAARLLRELCRLRVLPPRVALFWWRARSLARASGDDWSLLSAARPAELRDLLALARERRELVEVGTGTAWTALALLLATPAARLTSYDPIARPERGRYLELAPGARARLRLVGTGGEHGPQAGEHAVELLFVDSSHEREETVASFRAWRAHLAPGAAVAFHDYDHPGYPGVREAVEELGLRGEVLGPLFVWRAPE